jgi:Ras-related protein Rab-8A
MGIIMTYSINDLASFQALENWLKQIKTHASEDVVKILVGNKCDVPERKVSYEEGKRMAEQFGVEYF